MASLNHALENTPTPVHFVDNLILDNPFLGVLPKTSTGDHV